MVSRVEYYFCSLLDGEPTDCTTDIVEQRNIPPFFASIIQRLANHSNNNIMKKLFILFANVCLWIFFGVFLTSCEQASDPKIEIYPEEASIGAEGGTFRIYITTDNEWQSTGFRRHDVNYYVSPAIGKGSGYVDVFIDQNLVPENKIGKIDFVCEKGKTPQTASFLFRQDAAKPYGEFIDWKTDVIPSEGGIVKASLLTNTLACRWICDNADVKITTQDVDSEGPIRTIAFTISIPANPQGSPREIIVTVFDGKDEAFYNYYHLKQL